eukprot:6185072-Pleurochrysis_carterae.AAC.1
MQVAYDGCGIYCKSKAIKTSCAKNKLKQAADCINRRASPWSWLANIEPDPICCTKCRRRSRRVRL